MSPHLTAEQGAQLRSALQSRRDQLQTQLDEHLHGQTRAERAHDVLAQDGDDAPQRHPERMIAAALTDHEQQELGVVLQALARMAAGEAAEPPYGVCSDCDADIPYARLRAEPWALRCVACAGALEQRQARLGPRA